jgi:hypothetical protein
MLIAHSPHGLSVLLPDFAHIFFLNSGRSAAVLGLGSRAGRNVEERITTQTHGGTSDDDEEYDKTRRDHG